VLAHQKESLLAARAEQSGSSPADGCPEAASNGALSDHNGSAQALLRAHNSPGVESPQTTTLSGPTGGAPGRLWGGETSVRRSSLTGSQPAPPASALFGSELGTLLEEDALDLLAESRACGEASERGAGIAAAALSARKGRHNVGLKAAALVASKGEHPSATSPVAKTRLGAAGAKDSAVSGQHARKPGSAATVAAALALDAASPTPGSDTASVSPGSGPSPRENEKAGGGAGT